MASCSAVGVTIAICLLESFDTMDIIGIEHNFVALSEKPAHL